MANKFKIKVTKLKELDVPGRHLTHNLSEGETKIGTTYHLPKLGEPLLVDTSPSAGFWTSVIQKILSPTSFRTVFAIYQWEEVRRTVAKKKAVD